MQRFFRYSFVTLAAVAVLNSCTDDPLTVVPVVPTSGVRFINALPDSSGAFGLDFRFVDLVENSAAFRVPFRMAPSVTGGVTGSTQIQYRAAQAGTRRFSIFLNDSIAAITSTKLKDSTVTLVDGKNYTFVLWGAARAGQMRVTVIDESTIPDPGTSKVALRVINTTSTPIEVRTFPTGGTVPAAATWANVGGLTASTFVTADTGAISYNVRLVGGTTNLFNDMTALLGVAAFSTAGAAGKLDIEAVPGTRVPGSAVSLIVFPASTPGARTPQTAAFLVPAGAFVWDRRPPRSF